MKLQTKIPLQKQPKNLIDFNANVLLLGSCFSDNIGKKLDYFRFQNLQNPFGILFHPAAIEQFILNAIHKKVYSEKDIYFHNEQWHCFEAHSKLSNISKDCLLNDLNANIQFANLQIKASSHIIITLGTAWVYRFIESNNIVANCHKVPQKEFKKELLTVDAICQSLQHIVEMINGVNSKTAIIFTVSPVRHLKDGFIENTQSKSNLISAIHTILNQKSLIGNCKPNYFPSYELMMDELRDYRFYNEDMIHPNQVAINYIWEKFRLVWISESATETISEIDAIQKGLQHKPFNPNSKAHQEFVKNLDTKMKKIQAQFPHILF